MLVVEKSTDGAAPSSAGVLWLIATPEGIPCDLAFSLDRLGIGVLHVRAPGDGRGPDERPADLALIPLGHAKVDALAEAGRLLRRDAATEIVFFTDADSIALAVAQSVGLHRTLSTDKLVDWLRVAGPHLVCQAQARRVLLAAERSIPALPAVPCAPAGTQVVPLLLAEQRFREAYLRHLLAIGRDRETVARLAGVPYRTVCQMIKKLDIDVPAQRPGRRARRRAAASRLGFDHL